jgi:hypothetical protein
MLASDKGPNRANAEQYLRSSPFDELQSRWTLVPFTPSTPQSKRRPMKSTRRYMKLQRAYPTAEQAQQPQDSHAPDVIVEFQENMSIR